MNRIPDGRAISRDPSAAAFPAGGASEMAADLAERVRREVAVNVGHELQAPLAKLSMLLQVLKECSWSEGSSALAARTLKDMERTLARQIEDVRHILALWGRKAGNGERAELAPVNLLDLMAEILEEQGATLSKAGMTVVVNLTSRPVTTDAPMVRHVFRNLLDNAVKYRTRGGNPWVSIFSEEAEGSVSVTFADNGVGLAQEELAGVFDCFYQADSASDGCGLGLSLCRAMMEKLGGRITIGSPGKNRGVTVVVDLPGRFG